MGEGRIPISDVEPGQLIKFQMNAEASGTPVSMTLAPRSLPPELETYLPPRSISITVNSVPQGAGLKVDGVEAGTTPKIVQIAPANKYWSSPKKASIESTFRSRSLRKPLRDGAKR